jgi:hypothetical protein
MLARYVAASNDTAILKRALPLAEVRFIPPLPPFTVCSFLFPVLPCCPLLPSSLFLLPSRSD